MPSTTNDAAEVILALRSFENRLTEIMDMIADKKTISLSDKEYAQGLLTILKRDIKESAKRGTVADSRRPPTEYESAYFAPALRSASANFHVATNSHPIKSNWFGCLYSVRIDINYLLFQLEQKFPGI